MAPPCTAVPDLQNRVQHIPVQNIIQNAAHILKCELVGDGEGGSLEEAAKGQEFRGHVYNFLAGQLLTGMGGG